MSRFKNTFQKAQKSGEKLLSVFVTAGYPKLDIAPELVWILEQAGADFVEIGIPFSDPIADGPTIQNASQIALENGMNLKEALKQVQVIRQQSQIPIILMGYVNPLLNHGLEKFIKDAEEVGVDGFIIPDLLPEEFLNFKNIFIRKKLGVNFLISPNTPTSRIKNIDKLTCDFIYCVSATGVTGTRKGVPLGLIDFLQSIRNLIKHPYLVGFGISNPQDAREIARYSIGVIVGSAIIKLINKYNDRSKMFEAVNLFVKELKSALKGV